MSSARLAATLLAALLLAGAAAATAHADGDPASDYLVSQKVFLPYDAKIPQQDQAKLLGLVGQATKQGFPIRVAVIASDYDLGSVTSLWQKPKLYARFLGAELSYYYNGRLLIVMPNGFGFNYTGHAPTSELALLARIPISAGPAGLAQAAASGVQQLAAAQGIRLSAAAAPTTTHTGQTTHDRILIVVAVLIALALGGLFRLLVRRRAAGRATG